MPPSFSATNPSATSQTLHRYSLTYVHFISPHMQSFVFKEMVGGVNMDGKGRRSQTFKTLRQSWWMETGVRWSMRFAPAVRRVSLAGRFSRPASTPPPGAAVGVNIGLRHTSPSRPLPGGRPRSWARGSPPRMRRGAGRGTGALADLAESPATGRLCTLPFAGGQEPPSR